MSVDSVTAQSTPERAARLLTEVFTPSHLATLLPPAVGAQAAGLAGFAWGCLAAAFTGVIPYAFLLWGVRRGRYGDRHIKDRSQRAVPILFGGASVVVGLALLATLDGVPAQLLALTLAMLAGLAVTLAITAVWKISIHTGVAAGTVVVLMITFGPVAAVAWPLVAATGWARVVLRDHTVAQVLAGALVGATVAGVAYTLLLR